MFKRLISGARSISVEINQAVEAWKADDLDDAQAHLREALQDCKTLHAQLEHALADVAQEEAAR